MITIFDDDFGINREFYLERLETIVQQLNIDGTITIKLGNEDDSRAMNASYRQKDYPTDVLSFPMNEELPDGSFYCGDILICHPVAEKQAKENNISLQNELLTLMVHGILHLAGYDHETDSGEMMRMQEGLLDEFLKQET
ncbi:MAG: rRNA maturation RNase YbeY [bacterium]|nr:rRNA maturation RNase YbeY [bacterium]